jgi:hypothetical protein
VDAVSVVAVLRPIRWSSARMASSGFKEVKMTSLAREVYCQRVYGEAVSEILPLKFPSKWAKNSCTSVTMTLHWVIMWALYNKLRIVDDNQTPLEEFTVVDAFAGIPEKEHVWNMVKFNGIWYSIDLSIEQYNEDQVTDTAHKPWNLLQAVADTYPLKDLKKDGATVADLTTAHPLIPKVHCNVEDAADFLTYWHGAKAVITTGFYFVETTADEEEALFVRPQDVKAVTNLVIALLERLADL